MAFGRYVILDCVGKGGMGVVYSAYDPELDRKVAVKLLRADRMHGRSSGRLRLLREAQAIARLSHPNVITVHDAGSCGDRVFIAMEYVEGRTLRDWLEKERPSWREVLDRFLLAGRGLAAAHDAGLIHRDFKPDNVLLARDGRVRVVDFGLARVAGEPEEAREEESGSGALLDSPLTQAGVALGTPAYMAPEQLRGEASDARSDQFSFCVALWEALYGQRPPGADSAGTRVPSRLREALLRGLSSDPSRRYPSMGDLLRDLERDRSAIRRRWLAAAAVSLVVASAAAGGGYLQARRGQLCGGVKEKLAGVWDAGRKAQVRAAFLATGLPFAETAWGKVAGTLDSYTGDWASMHRAACEATRLRGERSETLLDRQMVCMDQRLQQVEALVGVLSRADAEVVGHAEDSLRILDSLAACARPAVLMEKTPPPDDPALRSRIREVQAEVARARALQTAGKIHPAFALAAEADRRASKLPYKPLQGEAALLVGDLRENAGEFAASERDLYRALAAAEEGRDDLLKVQCWKKLVYTVGYRQGRYGEAHRLARLAEASLARAGGDPGWQSAILDADASVFRLEGKLEEALRLQERSLAIAEKHGLRDGLYTSLSNIGAVYQTLGDYKRALRYFRRALQEVEASRGTLHPETASMHFNLATPLLELKRYGEAEKHLVDSLAQREKLLGPEHPDVAESLDALGVLWTRRERPERALPYNERALRIYSLKSPGSMHWALAHNNLAEGLRQMGRHEEALEHLREALDTLEKRGEPEGMLIAALLDSLGKVLLAQGRPADAVPPLERAVGVCDRTAPPEWQADARFALARALREAGRDGRRPVELARQARALFHQAGIEDRAAAVDAWLAGRKGGSRS
ncbi:MAG TPA: serine/threonine-protein kinase [Thermoanaerobaculia bacterium]|nr:serine/threonine-protein kinase [Thermoanaerobaculia bacterium]